MFSVSFPYRLKLPLSKFILYILFHHEWNYISGVAYPGFYTCILLLISFAIIEEWQHHLFHYRQMKNTGVFPCLTLYFYDRWCTVLKKIAIIRRKGKQIIFFKRWESVFSYLVLQLEAKILKLGVLGSWGFCASYLLIYWQFLFMQYIIWV